MQKRMYTTQMDAAKKGIITPEMTKVADDEGVSVDWLRSQMALGKVIIPANVNHKRLNPVGVGQGLKTKVNVNLGVSKDEHDYTLELEKAKLAISHGIDGIMDLSNYGKTAEFREALIQTSSAMIGTVPIYDAMGFYDKDLTDITANEFLAVLEKHGAQGVDFVTIHAGVNLQTIKTFEATKRLTNIVSRGGSMLYAWMKLTGNENPFYEYFDQVLDICEAYDITLSLGDAMRPGSVHDATDAMQIHELMVLGQLTKKAWARNVQVMIEGPGHMAINEIEANVILQKKLCHDAPFYVLGPLVTDIAPGYDHITGAIGGAIAASKGADFLCYVTPAEHLRLPNLEDVFEGIMAFKIAAHAADIAKLPHRSRQWDNDMSKARKDLNWERMFELSIDPEKAKKYRSESQPEEEHSCTMCGKMCAMRTVNQVLEQHQGGLGHE